MFRSRAIRQRSIRGRPGCFHEIGGILGIKLGTGILVDGEARGDRASGGRYGRRGQSRYESRARDTERCRVFSVSPTRECRERGPVRRAGVLRQQFFDAAENMQGDPFCGGGVVLGNLGA